MKFGGTSVADADAIIRLIGIVRRQSEAQPADDKPPVVVVSALSGVTDRLIAVARLAEEGEVDRAVDEPARAARAPRDGRVRRDNRRQSIGSPGGGARREFDEPHRPGARARRAARSVAAVARRRASRRASWPAAGSSRRRWPNAVWRRPGSTRGPSLVTDAEHTGAAPDMIATCERVREHIGPADRARDRCRFSAASSARPRTA